MNEIIKDFAKGLIGAFIVVFLPKHIFILIREFIIFGIKSIFKFWILNIFITAIFYLCYLKTNYFAKVDSYLLEIALIVLLFCISYVVRFFSFYRKLNIQNSLFVYGCFSSKEKEYLILDLDAENINDRLNTKCEEIKRNNFIFKSNTLRLSFIEFPKFLPILLGYRGTKKIFDKFISKKKHISSLYFIRDINDLKLTTTLNFDSLNFTNPELLNNLSALLDKISNEKLLDIIEITEINLKLYILVFGQTFLDSFIQNKDFDSSTLIIQDSETILYDIKEQLELKFENGYQEFKNFHEIWSSYLYRNKAVILLEQKQYKGAITHIFNSIRLNPYYPYSNYETFKTNYVKRYGLELSFSIEKITKEQEIESKNDFVKLRDKINESIVSKDAELNTNVVLRIIEMDEDAVSLEFLEQELNNLDNRNPAVLLIKSEVIKYLPDNTEKVNRIYYGRIEESIGFLNKLIEIDNNFPMIKSKIGSLIMTRAFHTGNETEIEKGVKLWSEGMHFMTELGFKI